MKCKLVSHVIRDPFGFMDSLPGGETFTGSAEDLVEHLKSSGIIDSNSEINIGKDFIDIWIDENEHMIWERID